MITSLSFRLLVLDGMDVAIEIIGATRDDALAIADIHLARPSSVRHAAANAELVRRHCWQPTLSLVGPRQGGRAVGYMLIDGEHLDHLYVHSEAQARGGLRAAAQGAKSRRIALDFPAQCKRQDFL